VPSASEEKGGIAAHGGLAIVGGNFGFFTHFHLPGWALFSVIARAFPAR
jgi:hypothetical protein